MARVLGLKQLLAKTYDFLEALPDKVLNSFGLLTSNFTMIVWGLSANGKSNFMMQFLTALTPYGNVLYVGLEEGFESTMQILANRNLNSEKHSGKIQFADAEMTYDELIIKLKKKKSPRFIVIDSLQYWNISYEQYKRLKEMFKRKTLIFVSHADGKLPSGKVAKDIMYDCGIKVRVEGFIAFVKSRYGGNNPFIINEALAQQYWGTKYKKVTKNFVPQMPKAKQEPVTP